MTIKVLIADDSPLVRQLLADKLDESPDITVIGCARDGREAVDLTLAMKPDLVIMDLVMPVLRLCGHRGNYGLRAHPRAGIGRGCRGHGNGPRL